MTISDLVFAVSVLCVVLLAILRRGKFLAAFVAVYALFLIAFAVSRPRRYFAPGEVRCFDDWCVSTISAARGTLPVCRGEGRTWIATIQVLSEAKRIHQRAADAYAELEDSQGRRYPSCAAMTPSLSDEIGAGESLRVSLPFLLPERIEPAGVVIHHGDFPGMLLIGADQSFLHPPALHRFSPLPPP